ncbi:MAG: hypothetical protein GY769_13605 [bacterium]|nr:hypothetical protein [bacterium]
MRKTVTLAVLGLLLISGAGYAAKGFHYVAETVTTGTNLKQSDTMIVEGWVEGPNAKIVFQEVGEANPFLGEGKYILTNDGGETLYLVDPKENTHAKFDLSEMLGFAGAVMESGMFEMDVTNHSVEQLDSGNGPEMHGYDTKYYKYRTSYDLEMKIMGMKRGDHYVLDNEIWSAEELQATGFQAWMRPRKTGFDAVDTLLEGELGKVKGFPFKSVTTTRTEGAKKKRSATTTSTTEVTEFEAMNVDNSIFELNPDSKEVTLMDPGAMQAQDSEEEPAEEEEKGGFMKRLKKIGKGDG